MTLADLIKETVDVDCDVVWESERTPTLVEMRLHSIGFPARNVAVVLDISGVDRSHEAVWNWRHDLAEAQANLLVTRGSAHHG